MFFRKRKPHRIYRSAPVRMNARPLRKRKSLQTNGPKIGFKKIFILTLMLGTAGAAVYYVGFSNYFKIKEIKIDYQEDQDQQEDLKKYFDPIVGKNIFFSDTSKIESQIKKDNPGLQKFEVKKVMPSTIHIAFAKYPIVANLTNVYKNGQAKYIVNEAGFSVAQETENQNLPYIRIFTDDPMPNNGMLIEQEKLKYILGAMSYFENRFGMKVLDADYLVNPRELHIRTERYFFLWLDVQRPYTEQFLKLKKAIPKLDIYKLSLEYIDLRIGGLNGEKVIYKQSR